MEFLTGIIIFICIAIWILRTFVLPVANVVATVNNNNFVKEYIESARLINPQHFITTIREGGNSVRTNVIIADDGIHFPMPNGNHISMPVSLILYFIKDGDISYTNQVYSTGRGISLGKAIVGGIIAGPIGAVIGGSNGTEKLQNQTMVHDNTETYIYYGINENSVAVLSINGIDIYQSLKLRFPYKEYEYVKNMFQKSNISNNNDNKYEYISNDANYDVYAELPEL